MIGYFLAVLTTGMGTPSKLINQWITSEKVVVDISVDIFFVL